MTWPAYAGLILWALGFATGWRARPNWKGRRR